MSLPSLRAIAEKIQTSSSRVDSDVNHLSTDLEDLTLEDENFVVKTLSHNTARKKFLQSSGFSPAHCMTDYSGEFSHWNFSQKVRKRVDQCLVDNITEVSSYLTIDRHRLKIKGY
jgi:hypothetical protein